MPVVFKGGTSGSVHADFRSGTPSSGQSQPLLDTSSHPAVPSTIQLQADSFDREDDSTDSATFMPTVGVVSEKLGNGRLSIPTSEDIMQQDITSMGPDSGDMSVFKGAPNDGTKGGPAVPGR